MAEDYNRLIYRRQFYLTPTSVQIEGLFNHVQLNNIYNLYYHQDLNFSFRNSNKISLYLLGDIFDPYNPTYTNNDVINSLITYSFKELLLKTNIYTGRYVFIFVEGEIIQIFNDPATARKIYYTEFSDQIWCGSQPHVLANLLNIAKSTDKDKLAYFESDYFIKKEFAGIYHYTIYDEIYQLSPNHYLDFNLKKRVRFWPNERINIMPIDEVVKKSGDLVTGFMKALYHRYKKLMLPITAGMDSRFLLAASRNISQDVFYYIYKLPKMKTNHLDIRIGKKVVESLGLKFHILTADQDIDEKFREIYLKNTFYPYENRLPLINTYFKLYPDYINLPGNFSEVGRNAWDFYRSKITGLDLVNLTWIGNFKYSLYKSNEWINEVEDLCNKYNINILDLHYWENRMTIWGTHYPSNKDIAQEEILPLNSRQLMITLLSTKRKYRNRDDCLLHRRILKYLWKETLCVPVNPSFEKYAQIFIKYTGIFNFINMIKHHLKIVYRNFFGHK